MSIVDGGRIKYSEIVRFFNVIGVVGNVNRKEDRS